MPGVITKATLLDMICAEHANLNALLDGLDDRRIIQPEVEGQWSVKDIVAHLVFWEQLVADELKLVAAGKAPRAIPREEIQPLNEQNFQTNQRRSMAEINADLQRSMRDMLENVAALSEGVLASTCTWTDEGSIARHVANEMEHWQDHMAVIHKWLGEAQ